MKIKIIGLLFLLLSAQCQNDNITDMSGSWSWEHNSEKREFRLDIKFINNVFYGSYCAIRNYGANVDCAIKLDTINYNFKIIPSRKDQYRFKFNHNGNSYGGIAKIKISDKDKIVWVLDSLASPYVQVPDSAVLTRISYKQAVVKKAIAEDSLKRGHKSEYIYVKEKSGLRYAYIKMDHFTINHNRFNQKVNSEINLVKCVPSAYEMDGSIYKYNTCKCANNTIYTSGDHVMIGASIVDKVFTIDKLGVKIGDDFQNVWDKLGQPNIKKISKSIHQIHLIIENSSSAKSAYFEFTNDILTKIYVSMDAY